MSKALVSVHWKKMAKKPGKSLFVTAHIQSDLMLVAGMNSLLAVSW